MSTRRLILGGLLLGWPLVAFLALLARLCYMEPLLLVGFGVLAVVMASMTLGLLLLSS